MISTVPTCARCKRRHIVSYSVEPQEAVATILLNRWKTGVCIVCLDELAEQGKIKIGFRNVEAVAWSDRPPPRNPHKRRR